jgi:uncharacterized membrane protein/uncharacterized protein (UPF0548 family)
MAEWRLLQTWTREELRARLAAASSLLPSVPDGPLRRADGWNHVLSHAVIGVEEPGPAEAQGIYERARLLVSRLGFSDPRIVVGHWRDNAHLRNRTVLLELKSLGFHFLCPVRVCAVREERDERHSLFGFCFETLGGHVESGREWFLLEKDHQSGEVSFHIEADWRPGEFPNWWSELGFRALGRRYQRAWHRLAHRHLREAVRRWGREDRKARGHAAKHEEVGAPVQFFAQRAITPVQVDEEAEQMRKNDSLFAAAAFGALSGGRSAIGPALLALENGQRRFGRKRARRVANVLQLVAAAEVVADKLPFTPSRTKAVSVVARATSGGIVGAAISPRVRLAGAAVGALAAVAATFVLHRLRSGLTNRLRIPNLIAGVLEDALVIGLGSRLASRVA